MPPLRKIGILEAEVLASTHELIPVTVRGTEVLRFAKANRPLDPRLQEIEWDEFARVAEKRGVAVYESGGFLKIKRDRGE